MMSGYTPRGLPPSLAEQGYIPVGMSRLISPSLLHHNSLGMTWARASQMVPRNRLADDGRTWQSPFQQLQAPY